MRGSAGTNAGTSGAATIALALSLMVPAAARLVFGVDPARELIAGAYSGLVLLAGVLVLSGLVARTRWRTTDAVIELSDASQSQVVTALREEARSRPDGGDPRALLAAADLLESHARLQADLARSVAELRDSRRRLVEAGVTERRRLGQSLDGGARRYLDEIRETVASLAPGADDELRELIAACCAEVDRTQEDLDQIARGLHPRLLVEQGLGAALTDLATRCPLQVELRVLPGRLPDSVESTVWYACAEALTNVVKHAGATTAAVEVTAGRDEVTASVQDDGVGGAAPVAGGGLAGLADRVNVVGGRLSVEQCPAGGTRVQVRVPVPS